MTLPLALGASVLFAVGTYLLLSRKLSRVILGLALMSHGANVMLLTSAGRRGVAVFVGDAGDPSDPLPQALALTAIVISFGITAFLLALAYRNWVLTGDDEVENDLEDRMVARRAGTSRDVTDATAAEHTTDDLHEGDEEVGR